MARKQLQGSGKDPSAGKLATAGRVAKKIFTPTKEQPRDPNAKSAKKKQGITPEVLRNICASQNAPGPGTDRTGSRHLSMSEYRRLMTPGG